MPTPTSKTPEQLKIEADAAANKKPEDKLLEPTSPAAMFLKSVIGAKAPEEKPKPKPEDEEGEEGVKPKKKKAAPPTPPPTPVIDEDKLGAAISKGITEANEAAARKAEEAKKPQPTAAEKTDARRIAVLERMEKLNGERYGGLAERFKENKTKLQKYAADWEAANPGEKFDEGHEDHAEFIDSLEAQVDYDDDDYTEALADIRLDSKVKEKESVLDQRLSEVERAERSRKEAPKIVEAGVQSGNDFWKELGDDFKEVVTETGAINGEALKAIQESDPIKYDIVVGAAQQAEVAAQVIYMLANNLLAYDPKNPTHAGLASFSLGEESKMMRRPAENRLDEEGRPFARKADFDKMPKEQRAKHWTFSADDLAFLAARATASRAKADLAAEDEKFQKRAKARGLIKEEEKPLPATSRRAAVRGAVDDDDSGDDDAGGDGKPLSPSLSTSPKLAAGKGGVGGAGKTGAERFLAKLIG